jgi:hypothetical protein
MLVEELPRPHHTATRTATRTASLPLWLVSVAASCGAIERASLRWCIRAVACLLLAYAKWPARLGPACGGEHKNVVRNMQTEALAVVWAHACKLDQVANQLTQACCMHTVDQSRSLVSQARAWCGIRRSRCGVAARMLEDKTGAGNHHWVFLFLQSRTPLATADL